jgi:DNA-binding response OmpR family regulator
MEEVKQILVVDDYFQMLEFLRSVLEFSHHEYQVLAVPSAEEGVLELRRTPFDLVITDVRLPGMSGFDMVRKIKQFNPDIPIIMITAYSTEQGKKEADELGVKRYFKKPLDPDELLAAVHSILYGAKETTEDERVVESEDVLLSTEVRRRLETLRSDTGARFVMLSSLEGQIMFDDGGGQRLDLPTLASGIAESMRTSFQLAQQLESPEPFTIQFQSGQSFDLYFANIGQDYIVSIFFDAQARRGRLGTVWVFAQRAINDLRDLLALNQLVDLPTAPQPDELVLPETAEAEAPTPAAEAVEEPVEAVLETAETTESAEPDDEAVDLESTQEIVPPSLEDIRAFLGIEEPGEAEEVDLDSFWDDALEESGKGKLNSSGMSLEEARKQGLIPTEFDQQGRPKEPD